VDVLEDEHRRPVARHGLDEHANREEERLAVGDRALRVEAEQDRQVAADRLRVVVADQRGDPFAELLQAGFPRVRLEDPAELLDLDREREVRTAFAIGKGAALDRAPAEVLDGLRELCC
jgi:hypothetical protein